MHIKKLAFDFTSCNCFLACKTFAFSYTKKNNNFSTFFDSLVYEFIHRIDFKSFSTPSKTGRLRCRISKTDYSAPECFTRLMKLLTKYNLSPKHTRLIRYIFSVLTQEVKQPKESDINLYIEFSKPLGLRYCSFVSDIEECLGKCVDIITKEALYNPTTLQNNQQLIQGISEECKCVYTKTDE